MFNVEQFNRVEYTFCNDSYSYGVDMNDKKYKAIEHKSNVFGKISWQKISDYEYDLALGEAVQ